MKITIAVVAVSALVLATAPSAAPGDELTGNSLQVRFVGAPGGSVLHFIPDQRAHMILRRSGQETQDIARWTVQDGRICFDWQTLADECWTYPEALTTNRTVRATIVGSTLQADVTLIAGHDVGPPADHSNH